MALDLSFLSNPIVWKVLLASAETAVQKASPDYTVAHHVAAVMASLTGGQVISTPTAKDAEPVAQAVAEAVGSAAVGILGVR